MKTISIDLPAMYGDHHVIQVRNLLLELPGVEDVYASSAYKVLEIQFREDQANEDQIRAKLDEYGYLGEIPMMIEANADDEMDVRRRSFRHTSVYEQTRKTVSFTQRVNYQGRPLWHCPGIGTIRTKMEDQE